MGISFPDSKRVDWAILQVAIWGDPRQKMSSVAITQQKGDARTEVQPPLFWVDRALNNSGLWFTRVGSGCCTPHGFTGVEDTPKLLAIP